ncbi:MAG: hypothetical protein NTY45_07725, partial [Elusimicrobia bacterium]|nr:hypothetical protein [Elusimicrobiota bacterium]
MRKIKNIFINFVWAALFAAGTAGPALAQFTGDFSQPGGAVYDGGSSDRVKKVVIDTHTAGGGPFLYVVGSSSQGAGGNDWAVIKYNMMGVKLASAAVSTPAMDYAGGAAVDQAGNLFVSGQAFGAGRIMKYDPALNLISSATVASANIGAIAVGYSGGVEYVYALVYTISGVALHRYTGDLSSSVSMVVRNFSGYFDASESIAVQDGTPASIFVGLGLREGTIPMNATPLFVTYKYSDSLILQASTTFSGGVRNQSSGMALDPVTNDLYVLGTSSSGPVAYGVLLKYSTADLTIKSSTTLPGAWAFGAVAVDVNTHTPYASFFANTYRLDSALTVQAVYTGLSGDSMAVLSSSDVFVTGTSSDNIVTRRINLTTSGGAPGGGLGGGVDGSKQFQMVPDGAGGAYLVYDSTVAEDGLRRIFAVRRGADNSPLWGPVAVSTAYYAGESSDIFAGSDGAGGVIAAWFEGNGIAYAQRYIPDGTAQWDPGGRQISSSAVLGGEFHENSEGGFFALLGYPTPTGMTVVVQKVNNYGICMWPTAGNCVTGSAGTVIPTGDFNGNARGVDAGSGSLLFAWPGDNGGRLALFGSKVAADGTLAWNKKVLAQSSGDEGATVEGMNDGAGGVYLVWTSSAGGAQALYAGRFDSAGDAYPTWSQALRLTDSYAGSSYGMKLAKDEDGFAVMYSTGGNNGNTIRIIRSSAAAGEIANGWVLNGKSVGVGNFGWTSTNLIYSSSAYHFVWSTWEPPAYKVYYQKTDKAGNYAYAGGSMVGNFRAPVNAAIAPDGTGGALAGWKMSIGGDDLPGLKRMLPATTENGFTGAFSESTGVNFDGGDMDAGFAAALYGANVYVAGMTVPAGAIVIKYDLAGNMVSSATLSGLESFDGVAVNDNGVYAAGKGSNGFVTAKYDHSLVLSSAAVLPGETHARDLALDNFGNVYVIGSNAGEPGGQNDYKIVKYNADLTQLGAPVLFDAGGVDGGKGIAYDDGYIYVTGDSLQSGTTYFVTAKFTSSAMVLVSSIVYTGPVSVDANSPVGEKLAVNPVTHDVYFTGNSAKDTILALKYDRDLAAQLGVAHFSSPAGYAQGTGIALDAEGNVNVAGSYNSGAQDYAVLLKYDPGLVFLSSAASVQPYGYDSMGVALATATGYAYMTGLYASDGNWENPAKFDMRTVRFAPLGGQPAPQPFTGSFSAPGGAVYDGGDMDGGFGAAFYGSNVYAAGVSAPSGAVVLKYDLEGTIVSSAVMAGLESFNAVVVNTDGVYAAGRSAGGFVTAKYSHDLVLSSAAVLPGESNARDLTLDTDGNVYVVGANDVQTGYKFVKYDRDLNQLGLPVAFNAGGTSSGKGIAVDNGNIYITGDSLIGQTTYFITARYNSSMMFLSSVAYVSDYAGADNPGGEKLAVDPVTHEVYFAGSYGTPTDELDGNILTIKYSPDLVQLSTAVFSHFYAEGGDIALDNEGNVYTLGINQDVGSGNYAVVLKYSPSLVLLSSATQRFTTGYVPASIAVDTVTLNSYVTGIDFGADKEPSSYNMRTVRFAPLGGTALPTVFLSTRDASPEYFMSGEEAAALSLTPYTDSGETVFSSMTVALNPGGNTCNIRAAALYYDTDHNDVWNAGDRLVSSAALNCSANVTFVSNETIGTQKTAYFITVTPAGGDNLKVAVYSRASFKFGAAMADQPVYPIVSAPKGFGQGSSMFKMVSDGAGGAYMVYDSTVAEGGLRQVFVERVGADNASLWGPTPITPYYHSVKDSGELFAAADGSGGVIAAWFDGDSVARAQRYNASGAQLWGAGGLQISSGVTQGGEFTANAQGGLFALFGYPSAAGMAVAVQKIDNDGQCQWPAPGDCVNVATGTALSVGDSVGEGRGIDGGSGSLIFVWAGGNGGRTALFGSKIAADGMLAWSKTLSAPTSSDEGGTVEGISDGLNGAYVLWTSSTGGAQALFAERFDVNGDPYPGWNSALRLSSYVNTLGENRYEISLARDEDGFAVLYSTGGKGRTEVRIVRSSATAAEFAAGWALDGKLAGQAVDDTLALIYDGSAYHFAWNQWAQLSVGNSHQIDYQKMDKDGKFSFTNGYVAGMAPDCLRIDIVSDGAGGALTAWKTKTGGLDLPVLRSIPAGTSVPEYTGTIAGNIYYEGQQEGLFHIAISTIAGDIYPEDLTYSSRTLVAPGGYSFTELLTPNTYYIQAWLGSGGHGAGQPGGAYNSLSVGGGKFMSEPLYLPAGAAAESVNITLRDFGQVSGTILAPQNGPVLLVAAPFEPGNPYNEVTLPSTGAYTTWIASSSVGYSLKAWIDANENHDLDGGEYYGERSLAVNSELLEQSGIDLELAPYSTSAFSGNFSQPGGAVYNGGDSDMGFGTAFYGSNVYVAGLSAPGGAVVVKYDLEGTFVSSSALEGAESFDAVAVNANGDYLAGKGPAGFVTAKYSHDLVLSSAAVLPGENHARDLALDAEGNVYVIGSDAGDPVNNNDYKFVKYDADLNQVGLPVTFDAGGVDSGSGIAADGGDIYVTGTSLIDGATSFVTARYDSALAFLSSAAYTDAYYNSYLPGSGKLTVNPATHDVYLAATRGGEDNRQMLTVRYSRDLLQLGTAVFPGGNYGLGMDVALDADGYVYALGKDYDGAYDNALVAKYTPALVFLSSAASAPAGRGYLGTGIALDNATGTSYVTGMSDDKLRPADIRTVRFAPLGGFSPPVVYLSTRDVSPMYYMKGEEAAALSITPRTDQGETTFSGMAVRVNTGGDSCSIRVIALYYDQNQNSTWDAGDRLVSSSTLDCGVTDQTFAFPDEAVSTRTAAYFVAVTPNGGTIGLEVLSHYAFTFGAGMAEQSIYPIAPAMKGSLDGSSGFRMVSDGAGGAYMVYDSTVAAGGLRQMFVERVGADNTPLWGPTPVIPAYYPIKDNGELFAASDGSGGVIAAWFDGSGAARAQRYNASGAYLWGTGGRQISSGTVEGGEFTANAQGGFFALFGYPSAAGMAVAVQKIDNNGQCQWPAPGDCVNVATGTALPVGESIGEGRGIDGGSGSLIFVWAGGNGGRTALFGSRIAADGTLAWNNKALSAPTSSDEGGNVEGISDGLNGAYVVWTSSTGGAQALFAERFNVNGDPYPGWNSALRLSSYINPSDYNISVARDEYGFAVLYSTGWNGQSEVRIVRSSATAAEFAAGWAQDGNLVGRTQDNTQGLVYDGSAYHFAWNQWVAFKGGNSHQISYQKMYKNGAVAYPDGYTAGEAPGCLNIDIVSDGAGGALAGWKTKTGGADVPELKAIPADNNVPEYSGAIQGNIYYEGTKQGAFHIAISTIANDIYPESLTYSSQTLGTPGGYSFSSLPAPNTYYIQAWLGEGGHSAGMPGGAYNSLAAGGGKFVSAPLYLAAGVTAENINITLRDFGLVSGTILAPQNGPVLLTAAPVEPGYPYNEAMLPSTGAYTTYIASSSVDYTLKAWIDANDNYKLDQGEFYGERPLTVNSGLPEQSGIDMALSPYSSVIFTGNFSETGGAVYDGGSNDAPHRLAVDTAALNGPFIYGAGTSSFGDDEAFIVKYDKYGVMAASAAFNVSGHPGEANGIAVGADSIFVAGNYDGTAHDGKCLILKYSKDLLLQSSATYSSYGYCIANDVAVNRSGGVYVTGHVNPSDESRDLVILKYDDNLHFATSVAISGSYDKGMEIRTDETGNVYAVGYSSVAGSFQILTLKYDPELVFISSAVFSS